MFVKDLRKEFYDLLLKQRVLIMVNYDVDAVCALKLITTLFKYDKILFTIIPVTEQSDMEKAFQTYRNSIKYFLLINVGAVIDITEILDPDEDQIIFIADSHRPLDVYNVYRVENVRLLMDEKDTDDVPDFNDLFREDDEEDTGGRSLEELERRDERRKWEERRKEILLEFAEYTYYGESVSYIFFKLAWKMSLDSNELLWLAIIGIFDLYVNDRITKKTFDDYVSQLKNHLKRLANSKSTVNLFDQANTSIDDILNVPAGRRAFVSIAHKKDLKITLYRHWNLYDSLQHTKLVSCRFKVWQRTGRCRFKEFLADLGIPLRQSKQKFASMDFELRKNIFDWIENLSEKYNLQGIIADSFEANHGYRHKFAAADIVYSLNALLESPSKELSPKENFMKTLDALSWSNVDYLLEGIEQSKQQLTAILNQVHDLIELRSIQSRGPYLFAQISRSHPEARIFCNPGCLHSLARFLLPAFVASQKKKSLKSLPLVVAVEEVDDPDASLAVGIPPVAGDPTRNLFSRLFVQTASELRIEVLPVLYDYNIIKVRSEHLGDILDRLVTSFSG